MRAQDPAYRPAHLSALSAKLSSDRAITLVEVRDENTETGLSSFRPLSIAQVVDDAGTRTWPPASE